MTGNLICFGFGYTAQTLAPLCRGAGWQVVGTVRPERFAEAIEKPPISDVSLVPLSAETSGPLAAVLAEATHLLLSIPPKDGTDLVLDGFRALLRSQTKGLRWIGYLSTVGVYGDHGGAWVTETTPPTPKSRRSHWRLAAEQAWLALGEEMGVPVQIFRLPGIYGPGRNALEALKAGRARRLIKPGQVFNRCHVADIANTLWAAMTQPAFAHGEIFNVVDDLPAPPQDVITYAAELMGMAPPPVEPFESARVSPMTASFYGECKRVRNDKIKKALGVSLTYPTYREGLRAIWQESFL